MCRAPLIGAAISSSRTVSSSGTGPSSACTNASCTPNTVQTGQAACFIPDPEFAMSRAQPVQHVAQTTFTVHTRGRSLTEITDRIADAVSASGVTTGITHVFVQHTSASLLIGENADPTVVADLERFF